MKKIITLFLASVFSLAVMVTLSSLVFSQEGSESVVGAEVVSIEKININTAAKEELMQLKSIGPKYAERIINYREEQGPFKKPEDIKNVKGIGEKTWEAIKNIIVVE